MKKLVLPLATFTILLGTGYAATPPVCEPTRVPNTLALTRPAATNSAATATADPRLADGLQNLRNLSAQTTALQKEFEQWWAGMANKKKGVFTSEETDRAGNILFRYMVTRDMLWNMVSLYAACDRNFTGGESQTRAFAIGYSAAVLLDVQSARLVAEFIGESQAIRKLNEIHTRYDIPAETFDALFNSVTSPANIRAIRESRKYVQDELKKEDSTLARIVAAEPEYARMLQESERNFAAADADTDFILKKKSLILPAVANLLRQNWLADKTRRLTRQLSDNLYIAQGILFNNVSDIKRPMSPPTDFNPDQVKLLKCLLQPGDLIFTFTAGYMSNVFLPGKFKHGITYVGTPEQRAALGLAIDAIRDVPPGKRAKLEQDIKTAKLPTGYDADVIEAVAEGVIFNSLDYLLKHHINRMVVLRPRVSPEERVQALGATFLLLGGMYDFNFDFVDTSYQCCTEVIYRAYNKKGDLDFPLVQRMAVKTLAADDIIQYHLAAKVPKFDFVVFAEEDTTSPIGMAVVLTGDAGAQRLQAVMTEKPFVLPGISPRPGAAPAR